MNKAQIKINHEAELNRDNFIINKEEFERADRSGKETVIFELVDSLRFLYDGQDMIFKNKKTGRFRISERGGVSREDEELVYKRERRIIKKEGEFVDTSIEDRGVLFKELYSFVKEKQMGGKILKKRPRAILARDIDENDENVHLEFNQDFVIGEGEAEDGYDDWSQRYCILARSGERLVGLVMINKNYIDKIVVDPEYRGSGFDGGNIAEALFRLGVPMIFARGEQKEGVYTYPVSVQGLDFCKKMGFVKKDTDKDPKKLSNYGLNPEINLVAEEQLKTEAEISRSEFPRGEELQSLVEKMKRIKERTDEKFDELIAESRRELKGEIRREGLR